jgi:hypothetical protein
VIAMSKKKQLRKTDPKRSEIIKYAVMYAQKLAAFHAGFEVDPTGDSEYSSTSSAITNARKALVKLNSVSPREGCLSADELQAKAKVLSLLYGLKKNEEPNKEEKEYIRLFAREVLDFLAGHRTEIL